MFRIGRRTSKGAATQDVAAKPVPVPPVVRPAPVFLLASALERISARGLEVETVIDVGASDGRWSVECERRWPNARYHLIEAQTCHEEGLKKHCETRPNASFTLKAAGGFEGDIFFDDREPFGGLASVEKAGAAVTPVKQITIDGEIARLGLRGPFLIKLDTHGYEVPIFEGAEEALKLASLVVVETYFFKDGKRLLMHEMVAYMAERGFSVVDLSEPLWREFDRALWQIDLFFIRSDNPVFSTSRYS